MRYKSNQISPLPHRALRRSPCPSAPTPFEFDPCRLLKGTGRLLKGTGRLLKGTGRLLKGTGRLQKGRALPPSLSLPPYPSLPRLPQTHAAVRYKSNQISLPRVNGPWPAHRVNTLTSRGRLPSGPGALTAWSSPGRSSAWRPGSTRCTAGVPPCPRPSRPSGRPRPPTHAAPGPDGLAHPRFGPPTPLTAVRARLRPLTPHNPLTAVRPEARGEAGPIFWGDRAGGFDPPH